MNWGKVGAICCFLLLLSTVLSAEDATAQQQVALVKELMPQIRTITVVCNVNDAQPALRALKTAANSAGIELSVYDVKAFPELYKLFLNFSSKTVQLLWMVSDSVVGADKSSRRFVHENCIKKRIPVFASSQDDLHEGSMVYVSLANNQPMLYINKAVADLVGFSVSSEMQSKVSFLQ